MEPKSNKKISFFIVLDLFFFLIFAHYFLFFFSFFLIFSFSLLTCFFGWWRLIWDLIRRYCQKRWVIHFSRKTVHKPIAVLKKKKLDRNFGWIRSGKLKPAKNLKNTIIIVGKKNEWIVHEFHVIICVLELVVQQCISYATMCQE